MPIWPRYNNFKSFLNMEFKLELSRKKYLLYMRKSLGSSVVLEILEKRNFVFTLNELDVFLGPKLKEKLFGKSSLVSENLESNEKKVKIWTFMAIINI